jgi:hypothetical protein
VLLPSLELHHVDFSSKFGIGGEIQLDDDTSQQITLTTNVSFHIFDENVPSRFPLFAGQSSRKQEFVSDVIDHGHVTEASAVMSPQGPYAISRYRRLAWPRHHKTYRKLSAAVFDCIIEP